MNLRIGLVLGALLWIHRRDCARAVRLPGKAGAHAAAVRPRRRVRLRGTHPFDEQRLVAGLKRESSRWGAVVREQNIIAD